MKFPMTLKGEIQSWIGNHNKYPWFLDLVNWPAKQESAGVSRLSSKDDWRRCNAGRPYATAF